MSMTEKTYSQRVARVFEIIDYFMLFPAAIGFVFGLALIGSNAIYTLLVFAFLFIGILLLVGYFKHSRGTLDAKYFPALWLTTAGYNFVLLLPFLYWASSILQTGGFKGSEGRTDSGVLIGLIILLAIISGYLSAILFSIKAFSFEHRKKII